MKKVKPKSQSASIAKIAHEERALWTTGDPSLDFEIVTETVKGVFEGGKWVYEWLKGQNPVVIHVIDSRYVNKHHVVTFTVKNISPHGVYIEDIALRDSMQVEAFQDSLGEPKPGIDFGDAAGKWVRDDKNPSPAPPFPNKAICPLFIPALESFSFNCAIKANKKKWATVDFIISPLSGKKVLKHPEVFRLRDR